MDVIGPPFETPKPPEVQIGAGGGPLINLPNLYYEGAETDPCPEGFRRASSTFYPVGAGAPVTRWYCAPIPVELENFTLEGLTASIRWVRDRLAEARHGLVTALADFLKDPIAAIITLIILVGLSLVMYAVYEALIAIEIIAKVVEFITKIGSIIVKILSFMQVDLLITILRLKGSFDPEWHSALADLYDALGSLAEEIGRDFSFISVFAEINRSILVTAYSLSGNAWLNSQVEYAKGVTSFLGKIESKMLDYRKNPEQIFIDVQNEILKDKATQVDKDLGKIMAAIGYAADWIRDKGNILIDGVHDLENQVDKMPEEIKDAIAPYYGKWKTTFDDFVHDKWDPFWKDYEIASNIIADYLQRHEVSIDELKSKINDPADWLRMLLLMDPNAQNDWIKDLEAIWYGKKLDSLKALETPVDRIVSDIDAPSEYISPVIEPAVFDIASLIPEPIITGEVPLEPPVWFKGESDALIHNPGQQIADRKSWYVGE